MVQPNPRNKQSNKQTNKPYTNLDAKSLEKLREDIDLITMWGGSLTAEILLIQLQCKINVGTETKISGLKLKIKKKKLEWMKICSRLKMNNIISNDLNMLNILIWWSLHRALGTRSWQRIKENCINRNLQRQAIKAISHTLKNNSLNYIPAGSSEKQTE